MKTLLVGFRENATYLQDLDSFCAANLLEVESLKVQSFVAS